MHDAECAVRITSRTRLYRCEDLRRVDISIDNLAIKHHVLQCGDAISNVVYSFYPFTRVL